MTFGHEKVSQNDKFRRKICSRIKNSVSMFFFSLITNFWMFQLGEKNEIFQNTLEKSRIYEITLENIFVIFAPEKVSQTDVFHVWIFIDFNDLNDFQLFSIFSRNTA